MFLHIRISLMISHATSAYLAGSVSNSPNYSEASIPVSRSLGITRTISTTVEAGVVTVAALSDPVEV